MDSGELELEQGVVGGAPGGRGGGAGADGSPVPPASPWARPAEELLRDLAVDPGSGLSTEEAARRLRGCGPNRLRQARTRGAWGILVDQFKSVVVLLLLAAVALSLAFGDPVEALAIMAVIVLNAALGFTTELRAVRSMEALRQLGRVEAKVRRGGRVREIPATDLVPGDIVIFEGGDVVSADLRIIGGSKLAANESTLTGESVPVSKAVEAVAEGAPLAERSCLLFKGTALTRGAGEGVVVATGMATELGRISALVEEAETEATPLEKRLDRLGRRLIGVTLVVAALVAVSGLLAGKELVLIIETAIALAVAAVPEGLPIVATIALARGVWRMAGRRALVNQLSAVETLGSTGVILTDKTGTLTENRMAVTRLVLGGGEIEVGGTGLAPRGSFRRDGRDLEPAEHARLRQALTVGALCNNATVRWTGAEPEAIGDPMEVALLVAAAKAGLRREELLAELPEVQEEAFDPDTRMMATAHRQDGRYRVAVKGAPEAVLAVCDRLLTDDGEEPLDEDERRRWLDRNDELADRGLRVLALATKLASSPATPYDGLTLLGLCALEDPARQDVRRSIEACRGAGIRVVMVTGDQPATARHVAAEVGLGGDGATDQLLLGDEIQSVEKLSEEARRRLLGASIIARASPEQKLDLLTLHQESGAIVAMTGDGVNDAPALKKADIGVAMGLRGTQVAREAARMVLEDDRFSTIVAAVEEGRVIFDNIRRFVLYLLSCNVSEILAVGLAVAVRAPLPILPLQILFLNLVTDVFPALALGVGGGGAGVMRRPPRDPAEPVLTRGLWLTIAGYGGLITAAVLGALGLALVWLEMEPRRAVSVSFLTLAFAQLWHVFNMRGGGSRVLRNEIVGNRWVWGALALCSGLLLAAVYVPVLSQVLKVVDPGREGWALIAAMSLAPLLAGQALKALGLGRLQSSDPRNRSGGGRARRSGQGRTPAPARSQMGNRRAGDR